MNHSGAFPGSQFRAAAPGLGSSCSARSGSAHHGPGEDELGAGKWRPIIAGGPGKSLAGVVVAGRGFAEALGCVCGSAEWSLI